MGLKYRSNYMGGTSFVEYTAYSAQTLDDIFPAGNGWETAKIGKNVLAGIYRNRDGKIVDTVFVEIDPVPETIILNNSGYQTLSAKKIKDLPRDTWKGSYEVLVKTDKVCVIQSTAAYGKKKLYAYVEVEK